MKIIKELNKLRNGDLEDKIMFYLLIFFTFVNPLIFYFVARG